MISSEMNFLSPKFSHYVQLRLSIWDLFYLSIILSSFLLCVVQAYSAREALTPIHPQTRGPYDMPHPPPRCKYVTIHPQTRGPYDMPHPPPRCKYVNVHASYIWWRLFFKPMLAGQAEQPPVSHIGSKVIDRLLLGSVIPQAVARLQ